MVLGTIQKVRSSIGGGGEVCQKRTIHIKLEIFPIKKTNKGGGGGQKLDMIGRTYFLNGPLSWSLLISRLTILDDNG